MTFADSPIYEFYKTVPRLWGIDVVTDQRMAGLIMKIGGGLLLWLVITYLFFSWHNAEERQEVDEVSWEDFERELQAWRAEAGMSQQYQPDTPMTTEVRLRLPLAIVIPLAALLALGLVAFGMSRILLSVPKEIAVIIAIAIGANVLIAAAFVALRPDDATSSWAELAVVALYPLIIGVIAASLGLGHGDSAGEAEHAAGEAAAAPGAWPYPPRTCSSTPTISS